MKSRRNKEEARLGERGYGSTCAMEIAVPAFLMVQCKAFFGCQDCNSCLPQRLATTGWVVPCLTFFSSIVVGSYLRGGGGG